MSKHTTGPWHASFKTPRKTKNIGVYSKSGTLIASLDVHQLASSDVVSRRFADARLIAAAPELLEALQTMTKQLRRTSASLWTNEQAEADLMACAAMAKAIGEQA